MSDPARVKAEELADWIYDHHDSKWEALAVHVAGALDAYAAERTAALRHDLERLTADVNRQSFEHIQQTAALRAALGNIRCHTCGFLIGDGQAWICGACQYARALLADPRQRGEAMSDAARALERKDIILSFVSHADRGKVDRLLDAYAAERTRYVLANAGWKETCRQLEEAKTQTAALREDLAVAHQIGDSFWRALKPLNLPAINVQDPGQHVTDLIQQTAALRAALVTALLPSEAMLALGDTPELAPEVCNAMQEAVRVGRLALLADHDHAEIGIVDHNPEEGCR